MSGYYLFSFTVASSFAFVSHRSASVIYFLCYYQLLDNMSWGAYKSMKPFQTPGLPDLSIAKPNIEGKMAELNLGSLQLSQKLAFPLLWHNHQWNAWLVVTVWKIVNPNQSSSEEALRWEKSF